MTDTITLTLPKEYGYVLLTAAASFVIGHWHGIRSGSYRRRAGIPHPIPYAFGSSASNATSTATASEKAKKEKAEYLFNCVQRAHGNYIENHSTFLGAMLIAGTRYPLSAAGLGAAWLVNRIVFAYGYTADGKSNGQGRLYGSGWMLCQVALIGICVPTAMAFLKN